MIKDEICGLIAKAVENLGVMVEAIPLEHPQDANNGDYASSVSLQLAKQLGKPPMEIADSLKLVMQKDLPKFIKKIDIAAPGFLNFWLDENYLAEEMYKTLNIENVVIEPRVGRSEAESRVSPLASDPTKDGTLISSYPRNRQDRETRVDGEVVKTESLKPKHFRVNLQREHFDAGRPLRKAAGDLGGHKSDVVLHPQIGKGKRVVVEYSGPNIAKAMGVGHLRSTIIGQALANLYKALGYEVITTNHLGDWGTQFGNLIAAYKKWGKENKLKSEPIVHLLDLYIRFSKEAKENESLVQEGREEFRKLEYGDAENTRLWRMFRDYSLKEFQEIYGRLGTTIEYQMGESDYREEVPGVYKLLAAKKIVRPEGEWTLVLDLEDEGLGTTIVRKSNESSLYITRDIAQVQYRVENWRPDKIIYVVGQDQSLHFKQLFAVVKKLGLVPDTELEHVGFGLVLLEGKRMRTREGKTIFLKEVLDEAVRRAQKIVNEKSRAYSQEEKDQISELIGVGSVKYNDLSQNRLTAIEFNWEKMLSLEGNSAPYLMYSLARARSILEQAGSFTIKAQVLPIYAQEEMALLRILYKYPEILEEALVLSSISTITTFLFHVAQAFNAFYARMPVLKAEQDEKAFRLALTQTVAAIIEDGLTIIGIEAPQRM